MFTKPLLLLCSLSLLITPLFGQDEPAATTVGDPTIELQTLKYELTPLTVADLEVEATAWRDLLKAKSTEIAKAQISSGAGDSPEIEVLRKEEDELMKRLSTVLDSWEAKGGDPEEMRAYLVAIKGAEMNVDNPTGLISAFRRWLQAEDGAVNWVKKLCIFGVIVLISAIVASFAAKLVSKAMDKHKGSSQLLDRFAGKVVRRGILVIGIIVGLATLGVKVGGLLALIGGGAFIIAFALQDTLSNFANGVMLMIYQPFDVGDAVEIGGVSGSVDSVSLVNTTIRSWDNKIILVPNKSVWGQTITNITGADTRRVDMIFGISYSDDIDKAHGILEKIVSETELALEDPAPVIRMHELADSSVNFICRPWAKTSDYWAVYWAITKRVKEEFDANGISIPFPQTDVHLHQAG
ncbi:mechanosensitive ion channel protein [Haloferula helveola]|uniref:Mechanosensitive ion channel protein n=1 Tax=Haloferula helveola TaxID=490095 RepID=A0ABM7RHQ3_9BACT|nr:mechanosensitive ion channel protein [Haloferula helveola]